MSISSDSENDSENDFEMLDADIHADMIDIPGLTADQQKVLAVVKNNVTEEGANISTDFEHLGSKFIFIFHSTNIQNNCIYEYIQWAKTNFKKL